MRCHRKQSKGIWLPTQHCTTRLSTWSIPRLPRMTSLMVVLLCVPACCPEVKEQTTVITGSKHINRVGSIHAPPSYPRGGYNMDRTAYIFILENVEIHGSVQIYITVFDLHPDSWLTVRHSKYSGYLGPVAGRYTRSDPPPYLLITGSCCLRIEIQTGCCGPAVVSGLSGIRRYTGVKADYIFVPTLFRGRRENCRYQKHHKLCNGECLPPNFACPCSKYGQYKCGNEMCIPGDRVCDGHDDCGDGSDESNCKKIVPRPGLIKLFGMYALEPILITLTAVILVPLFVVCIFCALDRHLRSACVVVMDATRRMDCARHSNLKTDQSEDRPVMTSERGDQPDQGLPARHSIPAQSQFRENLDGLSAKTNPF